MTLYGILPWLLIPNELEIHQCTDNPELGLSE